VVILMTVVIFRPMELMLNNIKNQKI